MSDSLFVDGYRYAGSNGATSRCDLRFQKLADGRTLIVWSERPDNPGMSVTNAAEVLAIRIADALGLGPEDAVFVEHYPASSGRGEPGTRRPGETWDLVTFRRVVHKGGRFYSFEDPSWRPMADADWRALGTHPSTWELQEA